MAGQIVQQLCKTGASQELNYTSVGRTILKTVHNNAQKRDEGVSGCSCPEAISAILKQMAEQAIPHLLHLCFFIGTLSDLLDHIPVEVVFGMLCASTVSDDLIVGLHKFRCKIVRFGLKKSPFSLGSASKST